MRWMSLSCALAWGLGGIRHEASEAAVQAPAGWLVWWAEGQKAARQTGKPIFLVFR